MSSYKFVDSTVSVLYCARCANEHLERVSEGRLVCPDCSTVIDYDPQKLRIGQLKGTKYKMRSKRRYKFREIVDEAREDAFREKFVPSPEPGRGKVGWRKGEEAEEAPGDEEEDVEIRIAGMDEQPERGWRNDDVMEIITEEGQLGDEDDGAAKRTNGADASGS